MNTVNTTMDRATGLKARRFTKSDIIAVIDETSNYTWALKATGALIESADLGEGFGGQSFNASEYRYGLGVIINTFLDMQEKALEGLLDTYDQSINAMEENRANALGDLETTE